MDCKSKLGKVLFIVLIGLSSLATSWSQASLAPLTVVVYNSSDPSSRDLAQFYAAKRNIPANNLVGLPLPPDEEISREVFNQQFAKPLTSRMVKAGFWKLNGNEVVRSTVRYAVLMRGVPLKIKSALPPAQPGEKRDPIRDRDEASVDSELAVLGFNAGGRGFVENPYYRRFTSAVEATLPAGMLLVTRLDAADDITVRAMIQDSLLAEKNGLWGWAYVDLRGITSGPYSEGDQWLDQAAKQMRSVGIPVISERTEAIWPTGYPITQAAIYYGWYAWNASGAFGGAAQMRPGSIAVHIHSFSASTLRTTTQQWCSPLLSQGAAVTAGNVYEPYLSLTLHLDTFQDRLMSGMNVADSAYMATPVLSWMGVVIGDPLYVPYANWTSDQLNPPNSSAELWSKYRELILKHQGDVTLAGLALKRFAAISKSAMPLESLANAQRDTGDAKLALASFEAAAAIARPGTPEQLRLTLERIKILRETNDSPAALALLSTAIAQEKSPAGKQLLQSLLQSMTPKPAPTP